MDLLLHKYNIDLRNKQWMDLHSNLRQWDWIQIPSSILIAYFFFIFSTASQKYSDAYKT